MPDKTRFERAKHKRLIDELKQRRAKGEEDLVIRNGSIIKKHPCSQAVVNDNRLPNSSSSTSSSSPIETNTQS